MDSINPCLHPKAPGNDHEINARVMGGVNKMV